MSLLWEQKRNRGNDTNAVWAEYSPTSKVGKTTLAEHQADVAALAGLAQIADDKEDEYDEAIDAKDANLYFLNRMNVRGVMVLRGNLEDGDLLHKELDDVNGMINNGASKIMARSRKLCTVWKKVNAKRAAATPTPLDPLKVGDTEVVHIDDALTGHEPLLKEVAEALSAWNLARSNLKVLADKVDRTNKRWFEAWSGNYEVGTPEHDALAQIDTGPGDTPAPGEVTFTVIYDGATGKLHIDASADHANHFRELRRAPGETEFIERASEAVSPIEDPVLLPGTYTIKMQAQNSTGDGPVSAEVQVTVPPPV